MKPATPLVLAAFLAAVGAGLVLADRQEGEGAPAANAARPSLALLSSLPIYFSERFALDAPPSPLRTALETDYSVATIDVADRASLQGHSLLLMAHPRAQPAAALDQLDRWVRSGGRLLLTADPRLAWHSDRPLGDRLRPPPDFADTGLLAHWGLTLEGPDGEGPVRRTIGGKSVLAIAPGRLIATKPACTSEDDQFVARCRLGKGRVTVIADSDWLDVEEVSDAPGRPGTESLAVLTRELARLRED